VLQKEVIIFNNILLGNHYYSWVHYMSWCHLQFPPVCRFDLIFKKGKFVWENIINWNQTWVGALAYDCCGSNVQACIQPNCLHLILLKNHCNGASAVKGYQQILAHHYI